jgi:peptide subunit release factor RF-3
MSEIEKQTEPITSAWMNFDKQRGLSNSVTNCAAFADFLLLKEQN